MRKGESEKNLCKRREFEILILELVSSFRYGGGKRVNF